MANRKTHPIQPDVQKAAKNIITLERHTKQVKPDISSQPKEMQVFGRNNKITFLLKTARTLELLLFKGWCKEYCPLPMWR